jgi:hypothetical protein
MELNGFLQLYNQECAKTGKHPKVKVSKEWYEKQLQSTFVLRNKDEQILVGIPVEFDDSINTFKFEYEE